MLGLGNTIIGGTTLSEWTPDNLGSTMIIWFKNDTGLTNLSGTDGNSDNRLQWSDQSGNNNHAIQDTDADKPAISEGGLDFELSETDYMSFTTGFDFDHPKPFTMFFVVKRESTSTQCTLIGQSATEFISFKSADDKIGVRNAGSGGDNVTVTFANSDLWGTGTDFILTVSKDSNGDLLFYKDGTAQAESGGGTSRADGDQMDILYLGTKVVPGSGTTHSFDGIMKEIIICDTVLSTSDRNDTVTYLKNKFSIS